MILFFRNECFRVLVLQTEGAFPEDRLEALSWLFNGAVLTDPGDPLLKGRFRGPRREMITPWSTVAVEICQNMNISGLVRIEEFFPAAEDTPHDPMLQEMYRGLDEHVFDTGRVPEPVREVRDMEAYSHREGLALNAEEIRYLEELSARLQRPLTDSEIFGFSQVNSEHCRHKIFNGTFILDGEEQGHTLFDMIRNTSARNPNLIVSAYKDNCAFIKGPGGHVFFVPEFPDRPGSFKTIPYDTVISLKAETHNFPTTVEPFNGAATGSGGEIRDRIAGGRASFPVAGTAVYMTSYPRLENGLHREQGREWMYHSPEDILTKASDGASDFGNKFGQPLICGSLLCFEHMGDGQRLGYDKVIMLAGGVGFARMQDALKGKPRKGDKIVLLGGDNYRIGMGGGAVSSVATGEYGNAIELNAVQRANPEMQKRVYNAIRALAESGENPVISIHDHGAGGHLNCLSELVDDVGGKVDMDRLPLGDPTLSAKEIIGNESQERMGLVLSPADVPLLQETAARERAPMYVIGEITGDGRFTFENSRTGERPIDLELEDMFGSVPRTFMEDATLDPVFEPLVCRQDDASLTGYAEMVMQLESVACKDWLTNKVDRSVTGWVANQQCAGELQLPLNDYGLTAIGYVPSDKGFSGIATSLGHAPVPGLIDPAAGSRLSIAEALTNLVFVALENGLRDVSLSANWMWPCRNRGEDARLYRAVQAASDFAISLGINIPTGKDSLSMTQKYPDGTKVLSPGTVIISTVAPVPDVRTRVRPVMDLSDPDSALLYIDLSGRTDGPCHLGGSALAQCLGKIGTDCPDVEDIPAFQRGFAAVQALIEQGMVLAGHDVSAGGLLTCLLEMCFANVRGGIRLKDHVLEDIAGADRVAALFSEYPGVVLQIRSHRIREALGLLLRDNVKTWVLGAPSQDRSIAVDRTLSFDIDKLRELWYRTSYLMDIRQSGPEKALERFDNFGRTPLVYHFPAWFSGAMEVRNQIPKGTSLPKAAIIREKGSQCDREMAWMLYLAGFDVLDVHTTDLISGRETLEDIRLIVFVGGFSNADTLGSAKGWAGAFLYNPKAKEALDRFYSREDTLSLGVCNGCQLMAELGLITPSSPEHSPKMLRNDSGKFECNFINVTIEESPSVFLRALQGSRLGIWVAHGEGKFAFPCNGDGFAVAARYSYDSYPANPNGSPGAVAAVTSACGRHLAMMPHPERCIYPWNWALYPAERTADEVSPWLSMFIEARRFCMT
ncbi:MAG: phosphoribosylformylglycinamidine synthase [Bacteroidales bacterium]|nr:phosphoribosylformylglycinamidine synthase [Bacteroidales bacterium]